MPEFNVGDRVRVRATAETVSDAGRLGTVAWTDCGTDGEVLAYHVRLDGEPTDGIGPTVYISFRPEDLEPETGGTP